MKNLWNRYSCSKRISNSPERHGAYTSVYAISTSVVPLSYEEAVTCSKSANWKSASG